MLGNLRRVTQRPQFRLGRRIHDTRVIKKLIRDLFGDQNGTESRKEVVSGTHSCMLTLKAGAGSCRRDVQEDQIEQRKYPLMHPSETSRGLGQGKS